MPRILPLLFLAGLLAGCGTGASPSQTATPLATAAYSDPHFHFSFHYPANWSVPRKGGATTTTASGTTYILTVNIPGNGAQLSVTVDHTIVPFPQFANGHRGQIPGDPHTFVYFHRTIGQWPAMRIERLSGKQLDEIDTIVNTRTESFDVRTITSASSFTPVERAGYEIVVKSLKIPFS
jgi:hypothetical protein